MVHFSVIDGRRKARGARGERLRNGLLLAAGVLVSLAGAAALIFVGLLSYAPWPWGSMIFGVGMPGGLLLGCLGIALLVGGCALAIGAINSRTSAGPR